MRTAEDGEAMRTAEDVAGPSTKKPSIKDHGLMGAFWHGGLSNVPDPSTLTVHELRYVFRVGTSERWSESSNYILYTVLIFFLQRREVIQKS